MLGLISESKARKLIRNEQVASSLKSSRWRAMWEEAVARANKAEQKKRELEEILFSLRNDKEENNDNNLV